MPGIGSIFKTFWKIHDYHPTLSEYEYLLLTTLGCCITDCNLMHCLKYWPCRLTLHVLMLRIQIRFPGLLINISPESIQRSIMGLFDEWSLKIFIGTCIKNAMSHTLTSYDDYVIWTGLLFDLSCHLTGKFQCKQISVRQISVQANFSASKLRGGKISVHRHLRALLKHLENTPPPSSTCK